MLSLYIHSFTRQSALQQVRNLFQKKELFTQWDLVLPLSDFSTDSYLLTVTTKTNVVQGQRAKECQFLKECFLKLIGFSIVESPDVTPSHGCYVTGSKEHRIFLSKQKQHVQLAVLGSSLHEALVLKVLKWSVLHFEQFAQQECLVHSLH